MGSPFGCVGHAGSGHRAELHLGIVSGSVEVVREAQGGSVAFFINEGRQEKYPEHIPLRDIPKPIR